VFPSGGRRVALTLLALAPWSLTGCTGMMRPAPPANTAVAEVKDASGRVVGQAMLTEVSDGVRVVIEARGLPPGPKAVHIHEVGQCGPPDFSSAGGHFNPTGMKHGLENPEGPHAGDLPNIAIGPEGTGRLESTDDRITLGSAPTSLFDADGSALVIHARPDDFKTDPAGASGPRIACGVILKR
jgi:superoxide dismutase, Cu-Zn family